MNIDSFFIANPKTLVRIDKKEAKKLMLDNSSVDIDFNVRYYIIRDIGLGICEVGLREVGKKGTFITKGKAWLDERAWIKST